MQQRHVRIAQIPRLRLSLEALCSAALSEREILLNLYNALNGDSWYRNDFWGSTASVCDWYGIGCIDGRVVEINLRGNNLVGLPGPDLFYLGDLQILWLYSNPINFNFENIGSAVKLQDLRLDATNVHSLHGIGAASSLISLDVRFSFVRGQFPEEILQLTNLRSLSMGGNGMIGKLPSSFASLPFLTSLLLQSNELTGRLPAFDNMNFLKYLDLSNNALTGSISKKIFDKLSTTENVTLDLANNQLTGVVPEELDRFSGLTIYLRDNRILGLPVTLCDNTRWNLGDVGNYGCDGILCKPGTSNEYGRRRPGFDCLPCPAARYYGETLCQTSVANGLRFGAIRVGCSCLLVSLFAWL